MTLHPNQQYWGSIDYLFNKYDFLNIWSINGYPFLMVFWNIFLLIIPFLIVKVLLMYYLANNCGKLYQKLIAIFLFFLWVLFFPNSAYIINDVRNLSGYCPAIYYGNVCVENAWMIVFFFIYAILGWMAFVFLLSQMKNFIAKMKNKTIANIFVLLIIPVTALGVLLGLINRFNSWEIFIKPMEIFSGAMVYFTQFHHFKSFFGFTIGFYVLYFIGSRLFKFNDYL
jgi:uncharacterized membrane protein